MNLRLATGLAGEPNLAQLGSVCFSWMTVFRARLSLAGLLVTTLFASVASASPPVLPKKPASAQGRPTAQLRPMPGKSIGSPTAGRLVGGARLADAPHLRVYPIYTNSDVRWGLELLVSLVDHAARSVRKQYPDAVLSVGHLSRSGGGELDRHASHESGRDADIGFYVKNAAGKPVYADHMMPFRGDGLSAVWPGAHFDDARNWAFVAALLGDARAHVTHIFIASPLRARLLAYAEKIGALPAIRTRAAEVLAQPRGSLPHDDHFHVRIGCPAGMTGCIEYPLARRRRTAPTIHPPTLGNAESHAPSKHAAPPTRTPNGSARAPENDKRDDAEKNETSVPSLTPSVPGLDSVVIPAPIVTPRSTWGSSKDPPPAAAESPEKRSTKPAPIDDPDGVLDSE